MSDDRYWLFSGCRYYPSAGLDDLVGKFATLDAAVVADGYEVWAHLLDTATGERFDWRDGRWLTRQELIAAEEAEEAEADAVWERSRAEAEQHAKDRAAELAEYQRQNAPLIDAHLRRSGFTWDGERWVWQRRLTRP